MSYPRKYSTALSSSDRRLTNADWDAMVDAANGMTTSGAVVQYGYAYLMRSNGGVYEAINDNGILTYGGSADTGGIDGDDDVAVLQAIIDNCTAGDHIVVTCALSIDATVTLDKKIIADFYGDINITTSPAFTLGGTSSVTRAVLNFYGVIDGGQEYAAGQNRTFLDIQGMSCCRIYFNIAQRLQYVVHTNATAINTGDSVFAFSTIQTCKYGFVFEATAPFSSEGNTIEGGYISSLDENGIGVYCKTRCTFTTVHATFGNAHAKAGVAAITDDVGGNLFYIKGCADAPAPTIGGGEYLSSIIQAQGGYKDAGRKVGDYLYIWAPADQGEIVREYLDAGHNIILQESKLEIGGVANWPHFTLDRANGKWSFCNNYIKLYGRGVIETRNKGIGVLVGSATTDATINLVAAESDATYGVTVVPNWNTAFWVPEAEKAVGSFHVHFASASPGDNTGKIDWYLFR